MLTVISLLINKIPAVWRFIKSFSARFLYYSSAGSVASLQIPSCWHCWLQQPHSLGYQLTQLIPIHHVPYSYPFAFSPNTTPVIRSRFKHLFEKNSYSVCKGWVFVCVGSVLNPPKTPPIRGALSGPITLF